MAQTTARFELPGFGGELIHPDDPAYDDARSVFNAMIDRKPAVIARCTTTADVVAGVNFAREKNLPLAIYGGGHSVNGAAVCDAGVVVDLRGMRNITVDAAKKVAHADGGLTWGEFDAATQEHGLACTGGRVSTTGVAGLALGSGSGWLERKFGFVCDNLLSAELVTADGRVVTASATENPELFWGIRGGGGNFGVVTKFDLQLHDLGPIVYGGIIAFPAFMAPDVVPAWTEFIKNAPDEVGGGLAFMSAPPEEFVPQEAWGMPIVGIVACYAGPVEDGEAAYQPLRDLGPVVDMFGPIPYVAVNQLLDAANPKGNQNYWTADFYDELPPEALETIMATATQPISPNTAVILVPGGGALSRVPDDATAFGMRHAAFNIHYLSQWTDPADDEKNINWTKDLADSMKPWSTGGVYLNFIGDEGTSRIEAGFGKEKFERLRELKKVWDPTNLFHINQNIPPAD
jgi:FAD/FMN-containing dehydrogenase